MLREKGQLPSSETDSYQKFRHHRAQLLGMGKCCFSFTTTSHRLIRPSTATTKQDVCAGIVLILESGGRVVPSAPPAECLADPLAPIPDADLGGRLYLAIRACSGTEKETAREAQDRLIRAVWDKTVPLDYSRPR